MKMFITKQSILVLQLLYIGGFIFSQAVVSVDFTTINDHTTKNEEVFGKEDIIFPNETSGDLENLTIVLKAPDSCVTPDKKPGLCVNLKNCSILLDQLFNTSAREFLLSSKCEPQDNDVSNPLVCCEKPQLSEKPPKFESSTVKVKTDKNHSKKPVEHNRVLPNECGYHLMDIRGRIVGGEEAKLGEFPWMVRLIHKNKYHERNFGCSGFLIHQKYILTAAHCVHKKFTSVRGPVFSVVLGEHDTTKHKDCDNCSQSVRQVQEVIIHENYDPVHLTGHYDDIALLHLKSGVKQSRYVRPVCLNRDTDYSPTEYTLSGWGKTEDERVSSVKMKVNLPAVNWEKCADQYTFMNVNLRKTQLCAGGKDGKDSCNGDSGGPLMFLGENNSWYAGGIVSFGVGCGVEDWPGVYTNIAYYIQWIQEKIYERKKLKTTEAPVKH